MFTKIDLVKQFGDWAAVYWTPIQPILKHYENHPCKVGLLKSAKPNEALLTIKLQKDAVNQAKWMQYSTFAQLQADFPAFKNFCIDIVCEIKRPNIVKLEFTVIDSENLDAAQMQHKHAINLFKPSRELLSSLEAMCKPQFDKFMGSCAQLTQCSKARVGTILRLYCVSSPQTPAPKLIFVPTQPNVLVISNVKHVALSWCRYMLQQVNLGIDDMALEHDELWLTLTPGLQLNTEPEAGAMRRKHQKRNATSLLARLTSNIWPW